MGNRARSGGMSGAMSLSDGWGKLLCSRDLEQRPPWRGATWVSGNDHSRQIDEHVQRP